MGKLNIQGDLDISNYLTASNTNLYLSSASTSYSIRFRAGTTEFLRGQVSTSANGTTHGTISGLYLFGPTYGNTAANIATAGKLSIGDPGPQIIFNCYANLSDGQPLALIYSDNDSIATGNSLSLVSSESNCTFIAPTIKALTKFIGTLDGNATNANKLGGFDATEFFRRGDNITASCNDVVTSRSYWSTNTATEAPTAWGGLLDFNTGSHHQLFLSFTGNESYVGLYTRAKVNGVWQPWSRYLNTDNYSSFALPLSGGTITGSVIFSTANQYYNLSTNTGGAIRLNNGDIGGVNSIYFKDAAGKGEGLHFYVSSTTVDTLRATGGVLYFDKTYDIEAGTAAATYTVIHSGNYTSYQVDKYVQQSRSTSTSWRALLSHYTVAGQGTDPGAATNIVYYNEKASIQPSTGKIYSAGGFIGNASTASNISSGSPTLAVAGESNALKAIDNYTYYTNDTPIKHSLLGIIKALDFQWYTSHWRIGNLRSGSTESSGFGFAFSANNSTWNLRAFIGTDGYLWANKLGSYNYGSTLPGSGQKGEIFFKT